MSAPVFEERNVNDRYKRMTEEEANYKVISLREDWELFRTTLNYPEDNWTIHISNHALTDAVVRADKRAKYYLFFHNMRINERKRIGLCAYWIVKLKPFTIIFNDETKASKIEKKIASSINERFAACLLYSIVLDDNEQADNNGKVITDLEKSSYYEALLYALYYRNISIDAMMLLVETLGVETFDKVIDKK